MFPHVPHVSTIIRSRKLAGPSPYRGKISLYKPMALGLGGLWTKSNRIACG
jgi:hypothetical protein